jgi:hypothetical protein
VKEGIPADDWPSVQRGERAVGGVIAAERDFVRGSAVLAAIDEPATLLAGGGSALPIEVRDQPLRQLHGVVLAAVVRIDLEHVGEVETGQRRREGQDVRAGAGPGTGVATIHDRVQAGLVDF